MHIMWAVFYKPLGIGFATLGSALAKTGIVEYLRVYRASLDGMLVS